ncbi:MAG TPA: short-chain fatty acyl-CoA regulator family protein [Rhizomicrobium sp.]|nr:short-chain fatty acyl-CoA regulator family protein [Rhizomicrobium sp.]
MKGVPSIGGRIQRLRRARSVSQAELAGLMGISPSYLNLIEHNRRRITVPLLLKLAQYFGIDAGELAESDNSRLAGDLMQIFGDEIFADLSLTNLDIHDVAAGNALVGRAIVRLFDEYLALRKKHVPGAVTVSQASLDVATDSVSDFLQESGNYFPTLESAAQRIRHDIDLSSDSLDYGLRSYLYNVFGLRWKKAALPGGEACALDPDKGDFVTADILPLESATFLVARQLGLMGARREIAALLANANLSEVAAPIAERALSSYFAAALVMPYEEFFRLAGETRYDIERISSHFKVSFEQVCHRMTSLQRPGMMGIPLHLVRADIAGNISKRFSLSGIHIPRHGGACPRWNVYSAFLHPGQINVQISQMPDGAKYLCIAKSITKGGFGHNQPRRHLSIGLGCHIAHAARMIYADGIDLANARQVVPIGVGCRLCPRQDCEQRAHPAAN